MRLRVSASQAENKERSVSEFCVPIKSPKPDINRFLDATMGRKIPEKVPPCEYLIDNIVMRPILEKLMGRTWVETAELTEYMGGQMDFSHEQKEEIDAWLENQIEFWYHMGYDYVRVEVSLNLPAVSLVAQDTAVTEKHNRAWQGLEKGPIQSWEDFERYPWPRIKDSDFYIHEYIASHLPDGLGFITCHAGGVYEHVSRLMGYTDLCMNLYDDPKLVKAVADRLGELILEYNERLLRIPQISAIFQGEDFGFNTQTLIPPDDIRAYFLPWHKKYASQCHDADRPYFVHSCGKIEAIIDDLIDDVKIDGKHSFQDNVTPVTEYKKNWGDRIALLGGVDVDKLAQLESDDLRRYVREVTDACAPGGRFAVGAGNSVTSYIPLENYLTMMDEVLR